ncbi:hypothetical protein PoB_002783600 [Plakobranchus ocellatus]|uniref:Uncharacterized protein n=1 Tax=Plakobranchus ocellatus TaxID=259542 RepID=A0AAV3ZQJ5_9GAST|nr:hypothetical protein PoB_002783600 [Plakobranchus ocellatus]
MLLNLHLELRHMKLFINLVYRAGKCKPHHLVWSCLNNVNKIWPRSRPRTQCPSPPRYKIPSGYHRELSHLIRPAAILILGRSITPGITIESFNRTLPQALISRYWKLSAGVGLTFRIQLYES